MAKPRPNLLLCFDAFGTLFNPKRDVALQYSEVARKCGITGFSEEWVSKNLKKAIERESTQNPNYGKATGLGATRWWGNVIRNTFLPILSKNGRKLPPGLVPKLLHRFASQDGYEVEPGLVSTLRALKRQNSESKFDQIVVGVVTNSDDRVPGILSSFGLDVSPLRYGAPIDDELAGAMARTDYDVDFHCMSYDVGFEKPDRRIFDCAELMLPRIIAAREGKELGGAEASEMATTWRKVYVGDESVKDVFGAAAAGWDPVLLDREASDSPLPTLSDFHSGRTLDEQFKSCPIFKVNSIKDLVMWLTGGK